MAVKNEKNDPGVMSPWMTRNPPYQMIPAMPITPITSMCEEPRDDTWMDFIRFSSTARLCVRKRSRSTCSRLKALTTRMAPKVS